MNETSRSLRRLGYLLDPLGLTDGQLLERFRAQKDEAAFEAILRRHGAMVLGVCRRILRNQHDAEDAFQATFFVLARKSAAIAKERMAANWLYGVAYRTARKAKTQIDRLHATEKSMAHLPEQGQESRTHTSDLEIMLDRELQRLPDKYRAPLVLCELEGRTHQEAAKLLGWPQGTLSVRLMRAKKLLAKRLTGQNLASATGSLTALLSTNLASANVPPALLATTAKTTSLFGACEWAPAIPVKVAALAEGVLKSMLLSKVKSFMTVLVLVGVLGTGAAYSTQLVTAGAEKVKRDDPDKLLARLPEKAKKERPDARPAPPRADASGALPAGALARMGSLAFRIDKARGAVMGPSGHTLFIGHPKGIQLFDLDSGLLIRTFAGATASDGTVASFAVSADGMLLAANSEKGGGAFLWDTATGQRLRPLETRSLRNATFRSDGKKLVVAELKGVRVLDVASGKEECRLVEDQGVSQILLTPDGDTLITASQKGHSIYVTDMRSKKLIRSLHDAEAQAPLVALSPDGKTLAVTDNRKAGAPPMGAQPRDVYTMRLVDLASGQHRDIDAKEVPQRRHEDLHYSPDGRSLLVLPSLSKCAIIDVASGKAIDELPLKGTPAKIHFTPDSKRLVRLDNKVIRVWDISTARELHPPEGPTANAVRLAFSPDGSILVSVLAAAGAPIYCWHAGTGRLLATLADEGKGLPVAERSVSFAPDGRLMTNGKKGVIRFLDVATFNETTRIDVPNQDNSPLSVASDGRTVASFAFPKKQPVSPLRRTDGKEQSVRLFAWDLATGNVLAKSEFWAATHRHLPQLSPDGKRYITLAGADICLKETLTNRDLLKLKPEPQPVKNGEPSGLGPTLILDANYLEGPASFSADGKTVALCASQLHKQKDLAVSFNYHVAVFDLVSGKERCRIPVEGFRPQPFALTPDGKRVAGATGTTARIWNAVTGEFQWEMPAIGAEVTAVAFSSDGNRLATALSDTTILVWDVGSRALGEKTRP